MKPKSTLPPADAPFIGQQPLPERTPAKRKALLVSGLLAALLFSGCAIEPGGVYYSDSDYYPYRYPYSYGYGYGWPYYGGYGPYYGRSFAFGGVRHGEHFGGHHFAGGSFGSRSVPGTWRGGGAVRNFSPARTQGGTAGHVGGHDHHR